MKRPFHRSLAKAVPALALALVLAACGQPSPEQLWQQAQALAEKADYTAAVIELKNVLQVQPDHAEARLLLGELLIKHAAYLDAETELGKASKLGAASDRVLLGLAEAYVRMEEAQKALDLGVPETGLSRQSLATLLALRAQAQLLLGEREDAEGSISAAREVDPRQPAVLVAQAKLALFDNRREEAEQLVDEALRQDGRFTDAMYLKAGLLQSVNQVDEAIGVYQQILANEPLQLHAQLAIARLQMGKGDLAAADKAVRAAETMAGNAVIVKYTRGTLEIQRGNLEKANASLLEVLKVHPYHLPSMLAYAVAGYGLGHYEQSMTYASRVLLVVPESLFAARILAASQLKSGNANGAVRTLQPFLAKHANDVGLMTLAGDAYLRAGQHGEAMRYLDKAAEMQPESTIIKTSRAAGHLASGDSERALLDLEQAAGLSDKAGSLSQSTGQAGLSLVLMRLQRKEYDQALADIANLESRLTNSPVTHNLRATALLGKQDRAGARKALEQALAIQPAFFPAALKLARLDVQEGNPGAARKRFESILARDKSNVEVMLALADLAAFEKRENDYVAWLEKAARADPGNMKPRTRLVRYHLGRKENRKALALAVDATNSYPDSVEAMNLLGTTQMAVGDNAAAIATFQDMTRKAPLSPEVRLSLALAQVVDKQLPAARDTLRAALQLRADFHQAQEALIRLELAEKDFEAAVKITRQIQAQRPASPLGFDREGDVRLSQKRYPDAVKAYQQALAKGAGTAGLIKLHGALVLAGDTKAGDRLLSAWSKQYPKDVEARAYAADVYLQAKRNREAMTQYEELLKVSPGNVVALTRLASLYLREKDSRALATAEQAFRLAPEDPAASDILGWILVEQGQVGRGLPLLAKAAAKLPEVASVRYHHGVALARSGRKGEARKELEVAIARGLKLPELEDARTLSRNL